MKKRNVLVLSFSVIIALFILSCNLFNIASSAAEKAATLAKEAAGQATSSDLTETVSAYGSNAFFDDFSDADSGWHTATAEEGMTDYQDGTFHIRVDTANYELWTNPGRIYGDVSLGVTATLVSGTEDNDFGLICRYQDEDNFYFGEGASNGYYIIGKWKDGSQSSFIENDWGTTDVINSGSTPNYLMFNCIGDTLTLYINGTEVASAQDSDFNSGDVGLVAGTFDTAGMEMAFDDFTAIQP